MPAFRFVAIDSAGQTVQGQMEAANEAEVVAHLQRAGNIPMRAEPARRGLSALLRQEVGRRSLSRPRAGGRPPRGRPLRRRS